MASDVTPVWDVPVRLFHWFLVALVAFSWWSGEQHEMEWHRTSGYCILGLLLFRIYWGVVGGRTARFATFVRGPRAVLAYVRNPGSAHPPSDGHNPLGGWSVVAMIAALVAMVTAGLFSVDVDGLESGPLADYVSFEAGRTAATVHDITFNLLLALIALHILAILYYRLRLHHDLIGPMINGTRRLTAGERAVALEASMGKAAAGVLLAAAIVWAVSKGFRF